jgi:hypothetical protein
MLCVVQAEASAKGRSLVQGVLPSVCHCDQLLQYPSKPAMSRQTEVRLNQTALYKRKIEARSTNRRRGKAVSVTYSECVSVALCIQHAKRLRRITLPSVD